MNLSHQRNPKGSEGGNGASKSIFNANYRDLKPSKSVDFSAFNAAVGEEGNNPLGMLIENDCMTPLLGSKERVVQVACGSIHTILRTDKGRLFSCGNGSSFALGHRNKENQSIFKQIEFFGTEEKTPIKTIAAGMSHSACVTETGDVYTWGVHINLQHLTSQQERDKAVHKVPTKVLFGLQNVSQDRRRSQAFEESVSVEDIKLGEYFTMALSKKGNVYAWGSNSNG